jgi:tetratricopeptide (TPR) repeat protein/predicted Ser/Thr protein kinase
VAPPPRIGDYELEEELARGGMGVVYRARARDGRLVALKVLTAASLDAEELGRLRLEATATAGLEHPSLLKVHEAGVHEGRAFLVMDLLEGTSCRDLLKRDGPLPIRRAVEICSQVASALAVAHQAGVLHRDLKPENVIVTTSGLPILIDFGLARLLESTDKLTQTGTSLGTPAYMAPEQALADREATGPRADVYGLGATLYALLTGRPPFDGQALIQILSQVVEAPPPPPRSLRPEVPAELEAICLRCLAKSPAERFPSAAALRSALDAWLRLPTRDASPPSRRSLVLAAAIVLTGLVAAAALLARPREATTPPTSATAPPAPDAALERAQAHLEADEVVQGAALAREVLSAHPDHPGALSVLGKAVGMSGDYAESKRLLRRALALEPDSLSAHQYLATACELAGDYQGALETAEAGLRSHPGDRPLLRLRAYALRDLERGPEAVAAFEDLIAGDSTDPTGWDERGLAFATLIGDMQAATRDFSRAIELEPTAKRYRQRANAYGRLQDEARAAADLQRALELDPDSPRTMSLLADLAIRARDYETALDWLDQAIAQVERQGLDFTAPQQKREALLRTLEARGGR